MSLIALLFTSSSVEHVTDLCSFTLKRLDWGPTQLYLSINSPRPSPVNCLALYSGIQIRPFNWNKKFTISPSKYGTISHTLWNCIYDGHGRRATISISLHLPLTHPTPIDEDHQKHHDDRTGGLSLRRKPPKLFANMHMPYVNWAPKYNILQTCMWIKLNRCGAASVEAAGSWLSKAIRCPRSTSGGSESFEIKRRRWFAHPMYYKMQIASFQHQFSFANWLPLYLLTKQT